MFQQGFDNVLTIDRTDQADKRLVELSRTQTCTSFKLDTVACLSRECRRYMTHARVFISDTIKRELNIPDFDGVMYADSDIKTEPLDWD